ncbi:MAG: hypothetical protein M1292_01825 [Bacteroidetes bacterium]|nr:hypothetical protein [Bacteroidota bacterium]
MPSKLNTSALRFTLAKVTAELESLNQSLKIGVYSGSRASVEAKIEFHQEAIKKLTGELEGATKQIHKLYHVEFFEGKKKHYYFGSQAAIYDTFTPEQIGITLDYLRNAINLVEAPYENRKCIIRLGEVKRKHTLRGRIK